MWLYGSGIHVAAFEIRAEEVSGWVGGVRLWGLEGVDGFSEGLVELVGAVVAVVQNYLVQLHQL